ncbi:MAG TPA: hypothetical protein VFD82_00120 [Planctomycetota bacterium]|nr:hypothetical protein [Planctomycetota bacterium]
MSRRSNATTRCTACSSTSAAATVATASGAGGRGNGQATCRPSASAKPRCSLIQSNPNTCWSRCSACRHAARRAGGVAAPIEASTPCPTTGRPQRFTNAASSA